MIGDGPAPENEPLAAARRVRQAAQVLQDAVARLEVLVTEREQRSPSSRDDGQDRTERLAEQLEDIAAGLEQVAAQMEPTNA